MVTGMANVKWNVDMLMDNGMEFLMSVSMPELQKAIKEARSADPSRRASPIEPWIMMLAVKDAHFSFPDKKIVAIEVRKTT